MRYGWTTRLAILVLGGMGFVAAAAGVCSAEVAADANAAGEKDPKDIRLLRENADKGQADAQFTLAGKYAAIHDYNEATKWCTKAAEQGLADAQYNLGYIYYSGTGVAKDNAQAFKWYTKAAEQGHAKAQGSLGIMYEAGKGTSQDYLEAAKWYTKSAQQGFAPAQYNLGIIYERGLGIEPDHREAVKWYTKAAQQGHDKAQFNLGNMFYKGLGATQDFKEAAKWYTKAAEQGYAMAQYNLGLMYGKGQGVAKDYVEAYKWISLAAAQGYTNAIKAKDPIRATLTIPQVAQAEKLAKEFRPVVAAAAAMEAFSRPKSGIGTAFFITSDGVAVTAWHVVKNASVIKVVTARGGRAAKVLKADPLNDVALLQVDGDGYKTVSVVPDKDVKMSNDVFTIGFPNVSLQGFEPKYTKGYISSLSGIMDDQRHFQISVPVQPGNSGGPLCDAGGNVVGIVVSRLNDAKATAPTEATPQNVNYAVKSSLLLDLVGTEAGLAQRMPQARPAKADTAEIVEEVKQCVMVVVSY